jgi:hypothetical protein
MKTATVTITGKIGPGFTVTSLVLSGVTGINFQIRNNTIDIEINDKHRIFDYDATATVTYVITGDNAVITIA